MTGMLPPGDPDRAASARVYSYLHDGADWYAADRDLALKLEGIHPGVRRMVTANRTFIQHAVLYASARLGITQFLDLGSGFPSEGSVLEHAQAVGEDAVVACVDWDPVVAGPSGYGPLLEDRGVKGFCVVQADIRDPGRVLADPAITGLLDFGRPVCLVFGTVLPSMPYGEARRVAAAYADAVVPGSAMVVTAGRDDGEADGELPRAWRTDTGGWRSNFTAGQVEGLFCGWEILPPGVGPAAGRIPGWASARGKPGARYILAGIAVKP